MDEQAKLAIDFASISGLIATIAGWLPNIAALATLLWTGIRIYETKTVQAWIAKRRKKQP